MIAVGRAATGASSDVPSFAMDFLLARLDRRRTGDAGGQFVVDFQIGPLDHGAGVEQCLQSQGGDDLFGPGGAVGSDPQGHREMILGRCSSWTKGRMLMRRAGGEDARPSAVSPCKNSWQRACDLGIISTMSEPIPGAPHVGARFHVDRPQAER